MSIEIDSLPGDGINQQNASSGESSNAGQENVQISLPRIDRPEGPFEHSGETAGMTEEEKIEKEERQQQ